MYNHMMFSSSYLYNHRDKIIWSNGSVQSYCLLLYIPVRAHLQCWETKNDSTLFLPQDGTNRPLITVIMHLDHKMATNVVKMARRWHQRAKCTKPKQYALVLDQLLDQLLWNNKAQQAHAGSYSS